MLPGRVAAGKDANGKVTFLISKNYVALGERMKEDLFRAGCAIFIIGFIGLGILLFSNATFDLRPIFSLISMAMIAGGIVIGTYAFLYETKEEKEARIEGYNKWNSRSVPITPERSNENDLPSNSDDQRSSLEILEVRYAHGEITREQYLLMKEDLKH